MFTDVLALGAFVKLLANNGGGNVTPTDFIQYGALGLIVVAFVTGRIASKSTLDRVLKERDAAEKQRDEMVTEIRTTVVPLLSEYNDRLVPLMEKSLRRDERMTREFEQMREDQKQIREVLTRSLRRLNAYDTHERGT